MMRLFTRARWAWHRQRRRWAHRLIEHLARRYYWHNSVLDTAVPNVRCLRVKTLIVVNSHGQERVISGVAA